MNLVREWNTDKSLKKPLEQFFENRDFLVGESEGAWTVVGQSLVAEGPSETNYDGNDENVELRGRVPVLQWVEEWVGQ